MSSEASARTIPGPGPARSGSASRKSFNRLYWVGIAAFVVLVVATAHPSNVESAIGAGLIIFAAVIPFGIWVSGRIRGLPLYPVFALTHLWTFGLPLLYEHPIVILFPPDSQLLASVTVSAFLLLGTIVWYLVAKRPPRLARNYVVLNESRADFLFLSVLACATALSVALNGGWVSLEPGIFSIIRAIMLALEAIACFVLGFRAGARRLTPAKKGLFWILAAALVIANLPALVMINSMAIGGITLFGYTLGAKSLPWKSALIGVLGFAFLQAGKSEMRDLYWPNADQDDTFSLQPWDYPVFFAGWCESSWAHLHASLDEEEKGQSLLERASLMQLLLYVQTMTPDSVPYMNGETYAVIPSLLVPRIFSSEKIASHEGTYLLNIHYGFQTREATAQTTIGFGLLNEAYANFGFIGVGLLAVLLGAYYAAVARWARMAPVLSFRSLFAVVVASYSFQTEFAAGVYVSALFQSTVALIALALVFMRRKKIDPGQTMVFD